MLWRGSAKVSALGEGGLFIDLAFQFCRPVRRCSYKPPPVKQRKTGDGRRHAWREKERFCRRDYSSRERSLVQHRGDETLTMRRKIRTLLKNLF